MNKVQFLDSLRRQIEDLPAKRQEEVLNAYSAQIQAGVNSGLTEAEVIARLGTPANCSARARQGLIPGVPSKKGKSKSLNPFQPHMIRRAAADEQPKKQDESEGKVHWGLIAVVTIVALVCLAFTAIRYLSSKGKLGYREYSVSFPSSEYSHIVVKDENRSVKLKAMTTRELKVSYYEGHRESYEINANNDTLSICARPNAENKRWYDKLLTLYDMTEPELIIYIPPDYAGTIEILTSNGGVISTDTVVLDTLMISTDHGSVDLSNMTLSGGLEIKTENCSVQLTQINAGGLVCVENSNGSFDVDKLDCCELILRTTNGLVSFKDLGEKIDRITVETTNASVEGEIIGSEEEFTIEAETTISSSNLKNQLGGRRSLSVRTTNGRIQVLFVS